MDRCEISDGYAQLACTLLPARREELEVNLQSRECAGWWEAPKKINVVLNLDDVENLITWLTGAKNALAELQPVPDQA